MDILIKNLYEDRYNTFIDRYHTPKSDVEKCDIAEYIASVILLHLFEIE